jgi:HK97 family phage major capsid protein
MGSLDSGAAEAVEGAIRAEETGLDLATEGVVTAVGVSAWKKVHRYALDDTPGLATMINSRLLYTVERRIESQILNGNGTGPNLLGVLATSGIGAIAYVAATPLADLILQGLTAVRLSNAEPSAVLLNPSTYETMLTRTATGSGERLDSGGAFVSPGDSLWGVSVIQSSLCPTNLAVVADWGRACTLFVREGATLKVSDSDQDDFLRGQVTVMAETRVGLAVWQPTAVATVALA